MRTFSSALAGLVVVLLSSGTAFAQTQNPLTCDQIFQLAQGTIQRSADQNVMNPTVCAAYQFLLSRYTPGSCSQKYVSFNQGITALTPTFAVNLANMLKAAPMQIDIVSGYRSAQAQQCANPSVTNSNHSRGCAVDLGYDQDSCSSQACQWVKANAPRFNVQLRLQFAPEWNHLEPTTCNGQSLGSIVASNASAGNVGDEAGPQNLLVSRGAQCAPQYICSGNTLYYQNASCSYTVAQQCAGGCSGNTCIATPPAPQLQPQQPTTQPAQSGAGTTPTVTPTSPLSIPTTSASSIFSNILQPQPVPTLSPAPSATQALNIFTNLGSIASSGSPSLNQNLSNIITTIISGTTSSVPHISTSISQPFPYPQDTFSVGTYQYAPSHAPAFPQILQSLKNVLTTLLSYLRSL